jgi:predicted PurR-regulated permease PerM
MSTLKAMDPRAPQPNARPLAPHPGIQLSRAPPTQRARRTIWVLIAFACAAMLYVAWPFGGPLFLAAVLAAVFQPVLGRLERSFHGRRKLAGATVTFGVFAGIVIPLAFVVSFLTSQVIDGLAFLRDGLGVHSFTQLSAANLPPMAQARMLKLMAGVHLSPERLHGGITTALAFAEGAVPAALEESGRALFHTAVMLIAFYFLLLDGRRVIDWLKRVSPFEARQTTDLLEEFRRVASSTLVSSAVTAVLQGLLAGIGFAIARVDHAIFFGVLTAIAAFIPVIGTALVWVPAVAVLALTGHPGMAIFLAIWCAVLVVGAEHVARPLILRGQSEMHTGMVFLGLLGGIEMFGLIGILAGPLVVALFLSLLKLYGSDFVERRPFSPSSPH